MVLKSTRNQSPVASFEEAIFNGLAPDGGLYTISETPRLDELISSLDSRATFLEVATETVDRLLGDELSPVSGEHRQVVEAICRRAFSFEPVIRSLEDGVDLLELYHGPSFAFKDFGASFLATSMEHFLRRRDQSAILLTATSGDTGSAVAQAFKGKTGIEVVILYPKGRVSPMQEQQLTTVGGNVNAVEVRGAFDDCQRMVKEAFLDRSLRDMLPLTSANSINIGRLLPQSLYYLFASTRYDTPVTFCVPSGNFGNLTAGVMARMWGMRANRFVAATNINDVVPEYLASGLFRPRPSVPTHSNAMDVGNPSNFERLLSIAGGDAVRMAELVVGQVVTDEETEEEIRRVFSEHGRLVCPHTAVGIRAARRVLRGHTEAVAGSGRRGVDGSDDFRSSLSKSRRARSGQKARMVVLATAHPGKFGEVITRSAGVEPHVPQPLQEAAQKEKESTEIDPDLQSLRLLLLDRYA